MLTDARVTTDNSPRTYAHGLQPLLQSLLGTLADLDFAYEQERERLTRSTRDVNIRIRVLERLKDRHRERRDPYIKQLAVLQEHIRAQLQAG
jgi:hypothetical protein